MFFRKCGLFGGIILRTTVLEAFYLMEIYVSEQDNCSGKVYSGNRADVPNMEQRWGVGEDTCLQLEHISLFCNLEWINKFL